MVSNGYSLRRLFLRRPKVCKASPNPGRCHPPPPPPPPPVWPPASFVLRWQLYYETSPPPPLQFDVYLTLNRVGASTVWVAGKVVGTDSWNVQFDLDYFHKTATLGLGANYSGQTFSNSRSGLPILFGSRMSYRVSLWHHVWPLSQVSVASFEF